MIVEQEVIELDQKLYFSAINQFRPVIQQMLLEQSKGFAEPSTFGFLRHIARFFTPEMKHEEKLDLFSKMKISDPPAVNIDHFQSPAIKAADLILSSLIALYQKYLKDSPHNQSLIINADLIPTTADQDDVKDIFRQMQRFSLSVDDVRTLLNLFGQTIDHEGLQLGYFFIIVPDKTSAHFILEKKNVDELVKHSNKLYARYQSEKKTSLIAATRH